MKALVVYTDLIEQAMSTSTPDQCDLVGQQMTKLVEVLSKR